ncbi:hypothetical protein Tco_1060450 [Tanacetum coccineum]
MASLFGKLKYEENLIDSIYEGDKKKSLTTAIPFSTAIFSNSVVYDFQDSLDDEEDTRSSQEYMNDLEMEFYESALLAKSKRFFKKGIQSSGASSSKATQVRNQGLVVELYELDEEEVSSDDDEMVEVKVFMTLTDDESGVVGKESVKNGEWVKITMRKLFEAKAFDLPNYDTERILTTKPLVFNSQDNVTDSSVTDYDYTKESNSVSSTLLPPLKTLPGVEPQTRPKTIKSILKSCSTRKAKTSKGVIINETNNSSASAKGNKNVNVQSIRFQGESSSRPQTSMPVKPLPQCKHCGFNDHLSDGCYNYPTCEICGSNDHDTKGYNHIISLRRGVSHEELRASMHKPHHEELGESIEIVVADLSSSTNDEVLRASVLKRRHKDLVESSENNPNKSVQPVTWPMSANSLYKTSPPEDSSFFTYAM